jgi:hypothetical protein
MHIAGERLGNSKVTGVAPSAGGKDVTAWINAKNLLLEHQEKIETVTGHKETLSKQGQLLLTQPVVVSAAAKSSPLETSPSSPTT